MSSIMELQPVILAAGRGSRMADISAKIPKALLPVGNLPMIFYPIKMLQKHRFEEVLIAVLRSQRTSVETTLRKYKDSLITMKLDFINIPDEEDWGTAESLRHIKHKIKCDLLVVSCDLVADMPLFRVVDLHRAHGSTLTALFAASPDAPGDTPTPGSKSKKKAELDFIGLEDGSERLLFFSSETDFDDSIDVRKSLLRRHPNIDMYSRLTDSHLYLISKSVVDMLADEELRHLSSLKGELIPHLVKLQARQHRRPAQTDTVDEENSAQSLEDLAHQLSSWHDHHGDMDNCYHDNKTRCYGHVMQDRLCIRANTVSNYCEVNRQISKHFKEFFSSKETIPAFIDTSVTIAAKAQVGSDSMIAESSRLADKVSVKKSMIGPHCHIGEKVKVTNSVIMDHVTIGEGCNIQNSIVCHNAHIGDKSDLKDTIVGSRQNVNAMSKFTNEVIVDLDQMMEI